MQPNPGQCTQHDPIKAYLAHWFQLGKKLYAQSGKTEICPSSVLVPGGFSAEFEACWDYITSDQAGDCYLEGTDETIAELRQQHWEIVNCARCGMPIALPKNGIAPFHCPCAGLANWPNMELPTPRGPMDSQAHLSNLQSRLEHQFEAETTGE